MSDCVIFDVDGTLVDVRGIRHYVTSDPQRRNFEKFHAAASYCPPIESTVKLARALHERGMPLFVVTSRMERWRYATTVWMRKWDVPLAPMFMRPDGDQRPDVEVKREILHDRIRSSGFEPVLAVDDNPSVIALWAAENIPTLIVPGWDEALSKGTQ